MKVLSPAKINLRLKVEGRRADGFHLLSMLNIFCDLYDEIELTKAAGSIELFCDTPVTSTPQENLVYRAAAKFLEEFGLECGLRISLKKNIPAGRGLAGGSGNAGTVLKTLSEIFKDEIEANESELRRRLFSVAASVGSDVPFFLSSGPARVAGVGEIIQPVNLPLLEDLRFFLVLPDVHLDTATVFKRFAESGKILSHDMELKKFLNSPGEYTGLLALIENDLAAAACAESELVREIAIRLGRLSGFVSCMSGSGSAFFILPEIPGEISQEDSYRAVAESLRGLPAEIRPSRSVRF